MWPTSAVRDGTGMTTMTLQPQVLVDAPDLSDFALAHRALRSGVRFLARAVAAVADGAPCSADRHDAIIWFAEHVLHEVAEHHRKEDAILWPVIVAAAGDALDLDELCDEHGVLDAVLTRATDAVRIFEGYPDLGAPRLAVLLSELADDLDAHIAREEALVFPVIREYVPVRAFERCRRRFAISYPRAHRHFVQAWLADTAGTADGSRRLRRWAHRRALVAGQAS